MRILFDQGTPAPLRGALTEHEVSTAYERGWSTLTNGELLDSAERAGLDLLITTDQNLRFQQDLSGRRLSIVVLSTTSWPRIRLALESVRKAVSDAQPGSYELLHIP
jgi:hypothetical protein